MEFNDDDDAVEAKRRRSRCNFSILACRSANSKRLDYKIILFL
jgi:hypothetical protein